MPGTTAAMPLVSFSLRIKLSDSLRLLKNTFTFIFFIPDDMIFLEDCSHRETKNAFVEFIYQASANIWISDPDPNQFKIVDTLDQSYDKAA